MKIEIVKATSTIFLFSLLACGGSHSSPPMAARSLSWSRPFELSASEKTQHIRVHSAAVNAAGEGIVTWSESPYPEGWGGDGWFRSFDANGTWAPASKWLKAEDPARKHDLNPGFPSVPVLLGNKGEGWVIGMPDDYTVHDKSSGWNGRFCAASPVSPGERPGATRPLGPVGEDLKNLIVASNGKDTILTAWSDWHTFKGPRLATSRYLASKGWDSQPMELSLPGNWMRSKSLAGAVTGSGRAFLAWIADPRSDSSRSHPTLRVATAGVGQPWSEPLELAGPDTVALDQVVMTAGPGETAALAWSSQARGHDALDINLSIYRPDTGWSQPRSAAKVKGSVKKGTCLAFTAQDQLLLAYLASDEPKSKRHALRTVWCTQGNVSAPEPHGQPSGQAQFGLCSDGNGHALLAWREDRADNVATVLASLGGGPGDWQPGIDLASGSDATGPIQHLSVSMGAGGQACAIWDTRQHDRLTGWATVFKPTW